MGVLGPWTGAQCSRAPSPPATPQCPWHPYTPSSPLMPPIPLHPCWPFDTPYCQNRNLVVKTSTTVGEHDMWSACWSSCCFVTCTPTLPSAPSVPPGRGIWWLQVVLRSSWPELRCTLSFQECRSAWHFISLWFRLIFGQMYPLSHPHPQVESSSAQEQYCIRSLGIWSAFGSDWPVYVKVHLVPAAAVIPALWIDSKVVAVKNLVCYCLQFSIDHLHKDIQFPIYHL